jgi:uncharacterized protein (DUF2236 family)
VSTGQYAAAADLVARSAAAFVSGVPEHPADDGFFGPSSATWEINADLSSPVAGLRSLLLQALHPLAMAGVDQHSQWRRDPVGRGAATSAYLTTVTYGDRAAAEACAALVRRVHEHVSGVDDVTGQPYAAGDPALLLWVHAALVDSVLAAASLVGTTPNAATTDRYVAEMVTAAELVGVPRDLVPSSAAELTAYIDSVCPVLRLTPAAAEAATYLLEPAGLDPDLAEIWRDVADAAVHALPAWASAMYDLAPSPFSSLTIQATRQALGILDVVFLGEPGVLAARQRIEMRRRAATSR